MDHRSIDKLTPLYAGHQEVESVHEEEFSTGSGRQSGQIAQFQGIVLYEKVWEN